MNLLKHALFFTLIFFLGTSINSQCLDPDNIFQFTFNNHNYEAVKENKSWTSASECAVIRGGYLTEINDSLEQDTIFSVITSYFTGQFGNTIAPDGGNASYVWIGGNDFTTEGNWVWDGNNDNVSAQFWEGIYTGIPIGGLYNNWGGEPDDWNSQDGLGIALTSWPYGIPGQWNDIDHENGLFFVIEYDFTTNIQTFTESNEISIFPNPTTGLVTFKQSLKQIPYNVKIFNFQGQIVKQFIWDSIEYKIANSSLTPGFYSIQLSNKAGVVVKQMKINIIH